MSNNVEEARESERQHQLHQTNLSTAGAEELEEAKARYLEKLSETGMSDAGIRMLDNMVDRSMALGNLKDAEVHEIKWRLHTLFIKICSQFPPKQSSVQGPVRAFVMDDSGADMTALSDRQRHIIAQMIIGIHVFVSRSRQGFQQEMMVKSINVSEVMDADDDDDSGLLQGMMS
ncbi:hypothetical protein [Halobacterium hubeiense]|uniref:hypothetical protein n=1 Tax=Halobacterium hubeiense TaxID=1407499 RepID=UPI003C77877F